MQNFCTPQCIRTRVTESASRAAFTVAATQSALGAYYILIAIFKIVSSQTQRVARCNQWRKYIALKVLSWNRLWQPFSRIHRSPAVLNRFSSKKNVDKNRLSKYIQQYVV